MNVFNKIVKLVLKKNRIKVNNIEIININNNFVERIMIDGRIEKIFWKDLEKVIITTTDEGLINDDIIWILIGNNSGCAIPSESQNINL